MVGSTAQRRHGLVGFFRREAVDAFAWEKSFMYGRSVTILPAGEPKIVQRSDKLKKMPI